MRKTLLLLLVLLFALAANAAPGINPKKAQPNPKGFNKSLMVKPRNLAKAPRKAEESEEGQTVDINITGSYTFYLDYDDEEETTDWFFSATDDTGMYTVRLDYPTDEAGKYGTYNYEDLDTDFSYIRDMSTGELEYRNYLEGTTFTVSEVNGLLHIEGKLVCDNGVTYNLNVSHTPQTYNVEGTELLSIQYFDEDTDWYMYFTDGTHKISVDINTGDESVYSGTYTEENAVSGYNFAIENEGGGYDPFTSFVVVLSMPSGITDPTRACEIKGTALTEHGDTYHFHMLKGLPITPKETVELEVDLKTADWPSNSDEYSSYFEVTEKDNPQMQWNIGLDALLGSLTTSDFVDGYPVRVDTSTGETLEFDNGTIELTFNPFTNAVKVDAALVMKDSVEYKFSFDNPITVKSHVYYDFSNLTLNDDYYDEIGYEWLDASNDEVSMEMTLTGAAAPGTFDNSNASVQMVVTDSDGEKSAITSIAIIKATVTLDEHNQPVLKTQFLGNNKRMYHINACFEVPTPKDTLNISIDGMKVNDMTTTARAFQIYGYSNDSTAYVSLVPDALQITGSYTTENLTTYNRYNMIALQKEDGSYEINDIYSAEFTATQDDKDVTLIGTCQAGEHFINFTLKGVIRTNGLDYDNEDEDLDVVFTLNDISELSKDETYGVGYVELMNAERNDIFAMAVYVSSFDEEIVIPAGTYEVNETYTAPSVQPGEIYSGVCYSTFYGTLNSEGYLNTPMWFLRTGTVTVTKTDDDNLEFEVIGKNSYERNIHVTLKATYDGIKDVDANAKANANVKKYLENGQVVIRKADGSRYTIAGQALTK